jgi:hypothetical protein
MNPCVIIFNLEKLLILLSYLINLLKIIIPKCIPYKILSNPYKSIALQCIIGYIRIYLIYGQKIQKSHKNFEKCI